MSHCMECDEHKAHHHDFRSPPLELGECLCDNCALGIYEELLEEAQRNLDELKEDIQRRTT